MEGNNLGKLESVDLHQAWEKEAVNFTPWLAKAENLSGLANILGIDIDEDTVDIEVRVGSFYADILCQASDTGCQILIENQLKKTDHKHLGQLLTYAAGLEAAVIIWIADRFTEEHRAALDWLNSITEEEFRFFGIEIELWRIGNSKVAPKFNIVAKPNEWSRPIRTHGKDSALVRFRRAYWTTLNEALKTKGGPVAGNLKPSRLNYMSYPIGRGGFYLTASMSIKKKRLSAGLYLKGSNAKSHFFLLKEQEGEIEKEFGESLEWEELPENNVSKIVHYKNDVDVTDKDDWSKQHEWLVDRVNKLHGVFADRVKGVDADNPKDSMEDPTVDD